MELTNEQREAAVELSPEELRFANLWLERSQNGLAAWECVAEAYPGHDAKNPNSCNVTAHRLINHNNRVRRFINAMNRAALQKATYDTATIAKVFMRQATTTEEKLTDVVEWRYVTDAKGRVNRLAWVPDMSIITGSLVEVVTGYTAADDGGYYLEYRELCDEKTRQKAAELLGKMAGDFVERVEHSGRIDSVSATVDASDPKKAAEAYKAMMKEV